MHSHITTEEIQKLNKEMQDTYEKLKAAIEKANSEKRSKKDLFELTKKTTRQKVANGLVTFLNDPAAKHDLKQLSHSYKITEKTQKIFTIKENYSKGEATSIGDELKLVFPFLSFPIPNKYCVTENPIFIEISRQNSQYQLRHPKHHKPHQKSGSVLITVLMEFERQIRYQVDFAEPIEFHDPAKLKITEDQIKLINPDPDPTDFFKPIKIPESPERAKT